MNRLDHQDAVPSQSRSELEQRLHAAGRRLLAAQQEKMEATAAYLALRARLKILQGLQTEGGARKRPSPAEDDR